jgi:hypothetical protein
MNSGFWHRFIKRFVGYTQNHVSGVTDLSYVSNCVQFLSAIASASQRLSLRFVWTCTSRTYMSVILRSCMRGSHTLTSRFCVGTNFVQLCALDPDIVGYLPAFFGSRQRTYITRNDVKLVKMWLHLKTDSRTYCCHGLWRYHMKPGIYLGSTNFKISDIRVTLSA